MTARLRRPQRIGIRSRLGGLVDTEERQQTTVTILFIATIVVVALLLLGVIAISWYNDNLRPVGKVGSVEIAPQLVRDRLSLEAWRITRDEGRVTEAQIAGQIDADTAASKTQALDSRQSGLSSAVLQTLVDEIYQSQLAPQNGVNVSDTEVDARYQQEISDPEKRHVLMLEIDPQAADATNGATTAERQAALDKANQALAELNSGGDFAVVAHNYGSDAKSQAGGDLGSVGQIAIKDDQVGEQVFALPLNATSGVMRGTDGNYYIARVTEITPGGVNPALKTKLLDNVSEQQVRQLLGYEVAADALQQKIVNDAVNATPEQVQLAVIYIEGLDSGDSEDTNTTDGEIQYDQILFAPKDDPDTAADLDPNDPAWATAKTEADAEFAALQAITDIAQRDTTFAADATSKSDDATSSDGGKVEYTTRDIPPQAISDALWGGTFNHGDLIGPVKSDEGYYVLMFDNKRANSADRVKAVQDALAQPGADFSAIARQWSDGPEKDQGGELGWFTKTDLATDITDKVWPLAVGGITDPLELGSGHYIVKLEDRQAARPLDADQQANARTNAFDTWYSPLRTQAVSDGTITTIAPLSSDDSLDVGGDQGTQ
jgi:parvulin-like peptidyl-prolyl isomerase